MSIRIKVVLPYLLLTLVAAAAGAFLLTRIVFDEFGERLTNQLVQSGRIVMDDIVRMELDHIDISRSIAYTTGLPEALDKGEQLQTETLTASIAKIQRAQNLIIINRNGQELLHMSLEPSGKYTSYPRSVNWDNVPLVRKMLNEPGPQFLPHRSFLRNPYNNNYYYYSAYPVLLDGRIVGVILVGTPFDVLLKRLRETSLTDIIIYNEQCEAIATTLGTEQNNPNFLPQQRLDTAICDDIRQSDEIIEDSLLISAGNRGYRIARSRVLLADDFIGAYGVALPSEYVFQPAQVNRTTAVLLMVIATLSAVLIGYWLSRLITTPLLTLVNTSQIIASGDLTRRSGLKRDDEIGVLASSFDIMTERLQQRTIELEHANKVLAQVDKTKSDFIQIAAHELRTPITLLSGYSQILNVKAAANPDLAPMAKGMTEGSTRMLEVVNSMLDISRIDSNTLKAIPEDTKLEPIIAKVQRTFKSAWEDRKLTLVTRGLADFPPIFADPDLLYKMFYHLIMNAIKYTPDGGKITVSAQILSNPAAVEIMVCDTGIGIDKEDQELIFQKFYQTGEVQFHSSGRTKFKGGGPGLGLAIVHGIVEVHGGRVWVESLGRDEVNNPGSCFIVHLPAQRNISV